ncbi:MAG: NAD(P)-dependent glycerol-3-phosphate dehydrogenase [Proteobacteria bacterium]|nr:NAD(P)-dependent glycerol-3-phosphate dehydrogenase [Pseudomonadota bacterium]
MAMKKAGIVGAGAWGTALAAVSRRAGLEALIWAFEKEVARDINTHHENRIFLPGIPLDKNIRATSKLNDLHTCDFLLLVVPAQFTRNIVESLAKGLPEKTPLVICSKGIEIKSGKLLSEVIDEIVPTNPILVLSGPSFAADAARGKPAAVTIAGESKSCAKDITMALGQETFRPYWSDDIVGAQVGGAVKNVLAIACGIAHGKGLGDSARAALITRGLAEMIALAKAKGGRATTLMGLCGLGDTVLTCTSTLSRNFSLGKALGEGKTMEEILKSRKSVTEGVYTAKIVVKLAAEMGVDMPISNAVNDILHKGDDVDEVIHDLLSRPFSEEAI